MAKRKKSNQIPRSLEEAFSMLDRMVTDEDKKAIIEGDDCHFGLGLWIRNNWFYGADCDELIADIQRAEYGEDSVITGPDGKPLLMFGDGDNFSGTLIDRYREHLVKAPFDIDYNDSVFHIFGIPDDIDTDRLCGDAGKHCSDDVYSGQIRTFVTDGQKESAEDGSQVCTTVLLGTSTQGVEMTYVHDPEGAHMHLSLPTFGSPGDVKLAFAVMKQLKEQYPGCAVFYNDNIDEGEFSLVRDNFETMVQLCLGNLSSLLEASRGGKHPLIPGLQHDFVIPCPDDHPEMSLDDLVLDSMQTFMALQWNYNDIPSASRANVRSPEGEEYVMRILTNAHDTFIGTCDRLAMSLGEKIKQIKPIDFLRYMEGNPYFERVDFLQFVIRKMPEEEWKRIFDGVKGEILN